MKGALMHSMHKRARSFPPSFPRAADAQQISLRLGRDGSKEVPSVTHGTKLLHKPNLYSGFIVVTEVTMVPKYLA